MSTEQHEKFESQESPAASGNNTDSTTALQDEAGKLLFENRDIFNQQNSRNESGGQNWNSRTERGDSNPSTKIGLPDLEIAGADNTAVAYALKGKEKSANSPESSKQQASATEKQEPVRHNNTAEVVSNLEEAGMKKDSTAGHYTTYKPINGEADIHGRTKVEILGDDKNIKREIVDYKNGRNVDTTYGDDGKIEKVKVKEADGKTTTTWNDMKANSKSLAEAYKNGGVDGLKDALKKAMEDPKCDKDRLQTMLDELKTHGIHTYPKGDNIHLNDGLLGSNITEGTLLATKPAAASPEAPKEWKGITFDKGTSIGKVRETLDAINKMREQQK